MDSTCSMKAAVRRTSTLPFHTANADLFRLDFTCTIEAAQSLQDADSLVLSFRDLFCLAEPRKAAATFTRPLGTAIAKGNTATVAVPVSESEIALAPSAYHVHVDLVRDGVSLCGANVGSVEIYMMKDRESPLHVVGSYLTARSEFSWDPIYDLYFIGLPITIPPTFDPFNKDSYEDYLKACGVLGGVSAELLHDGTLGFLRAARVFRATGESDRLAFTERVLRRAIEQIFSHMLHEDGLPYCLRPRDEKYARSKEARAESAFILKFLSEAILYFRNDAEDPAYARSVYERTTVMAQREFSRPLCIGCGTEQEDPSKCAVYDGRVLQGCVEWLNAAFEMEGACDREQLTKGLMFAITAAKHVLANDGWYDANCYAEGACHIICGNHNILGGLLAARRLVNRHTATVPGYGMIYHYAACEDSLAQLNPAIESAFNFIAGKQVALTGQRLWPYPGLWGIGHLYEECLEMLDIPASRQHASTWLRLIDAVVSHTDVSTRVTCFGEFNVLAPIMGLCSGLPSADNA